MEDLRGNEEDIQYCELKKKNEFFEVQFEFGDHPINFCLNYL